MPPLSRPSYSRELRTTLFFSVALAITEGSVAGVFVKQLFTGVVEEGRLNLMVALVGAAPEMANLLSFVWVTRSQGRPKVAFINRLQWIVILMIGGMALTPRTEGGLYALAACTIAARVCWSGIITLRPTVWRQNYPRRDRARMVGKFSMVQVQTVAIVALGIGAMMDASSTAYHFFIPVFCALGLIAVPLYASVRVRGERAMLAHEQAERARHARRRTRLLLGPAEVLRVLTRDRFFAEFQFWLCVLGVGNLILYPVLWIILKDQFKELNAGSVLIATTIPMLVQPWAIPVWARLLDRAHVVHFRSIHSWVFVLSTAVQLVAILMHSYWLLAAGSVIMGVAQGGGVLAWNMGHHDFAPPHHTSQYMAAHLTLNGIRGTIGPIVAVTLYTWLKSQDQPAGAIVVAISLALCVAGALGYVSLRARMPRIVAARESGRAGPESSKAANQQSSK